MVNDDPDVRGRLRVEFLPNYSVTLAERLIPASDVSEQISTAGYEASGTSNMKFMMNGALTVGTRDGATIEIAEEAGEENVFLFGLTAEQVAGSRGWYDPRWHYEHEPETRQALDLIFSGHFNRGEPGLFEPIRDDAARRSGDYYMHLADLTSYVATQSRVSELYADRQAWGRKAILNVARSGKFSSDRTIAEYAESIWGATPCPVGDLRLGRSLANRRLSSDSAAGRHRPSAGPFRTRRDGIADGAARSTLWRRENHAGPMRAGRGVGWLALGAGLASVAIPGCSPKVGAARTPPPPVVSVVEARRMTVPIMAEPIGTTRALQEVSIRARVRGFLKEIHFEEGGDVKAGQLLFVIDEEPFKAKLAEAQAKLDAGRGRP